MDQQQIKQTADRFITVLHKIEEGDKSSIEGIANMFSDDAVLSNSIIQHDMTKRERKGRDEIAEFWREYRSTFHDIHSQFTDVTTGENSAALFWYSTGTDLNGHEVQYEGVSLLKITDDNKIKSFKGYFDTAQLAQAS